jgi:hypothetical protein
VRKKSSGAPNIGAPEEPGWTFGGGNTCQPDLTNYSRPTGVTNVFRTYNIKDKFFVAVNLIPSLITKGQSPP